MYHLKKFSVYYNELARTNPSICKLNEEEILQYDKIVKKESKEAQTDLYIVFCFFIFSMFGICVGLYYYILDDLTRIAEIAAKKLLLYQVIPTFGHNVILGSFIILFVVFLFPLASVWIKTKKFIPVIVNFKHPSYLLLALSTLYFLLVTFVLCFGNSSLDRKSDILLTIFASIFMIVIFLLLMVLLGRIWFIPLADKIFFRYYSKNRRLELCMRIFHLIEKLEINKNYLVLPEGELKQMIKNVQESSIIIKEFYSELPSGSYNNEVRLKFELIACEFHKFKDRIILSRPKDFNSIKENLIRYINVLLQEEILELPTSEGSKEDQVVWAKTDTLKSNMILIAIITILVLLFPFFSTGNQISNNLSIHYLFIILSISFIVWNKNVLEKNLDFVRTLFKR